ncbi:hypothetical protein [Nioella halotolerans]|uniref:hypothetical protein n=1 Tax=Nioella halotolerans TaxID=2303578 RepID=UPI0026A370F9
MSAGDGTTPPILADKHHDALSAFTPENLLREARHQKGAANGTSDALAVVSTVMARLG